MDASRYVAAMDASTDPRVRALVRSGPGLLVTSLLADRIARQSVQFGANGNGYGIDPLTDEFVSVIRPTYPNEWSVPVTNQPQTFVPVPGARIRIRECHGCGVPGDCYCHENCNSNDPASLCNECAADWQVSRDDDHRDALTMQARGWFQIA
jgi:hypothetical protein